MLTPAQKKRLGEIDAEWIEVGYKRFECDTSPAGQKRWEELWARGKQLEKQRAQLLKEAEEHVQPIAAAIQPVSA